MKNFIKIIVLANLCLIAAQCNGYSTKIENASGHTATVTAQPQGAQAIQKEIESDDQKEIDHGLMVISMFVIEIPGKTKTIDIPGNKTYHSYKIKLLPDKIYIDYRKSTSDPWTAWITRDW